MAKIPSKIFAILLTKSQHILPKILITKIAYILASIEQKFIKNLIIKLFIKIYKINLNNYIYQDVNQYKNFNQFFSRKYNKNKLEQIYNANKNHKIISPADGTIAAIGPIKNKQLYQVKNQRYPLCELLGDHLLLKNNNQIFSNLFTQGCYATIYLAPDNYHRVHIPIKTAKLEKTLYIPGKLYSVNKTSTKYINKIFTTNERVVNLFSFRDYNNQIKHMAIILIGAMCVGSIHTKTQGQISPPHLNNSDNYKLWDYSQENIIFNQFEELGYFSMGSTVILLFSENFSLENNNVVDNPVFFGNMLSK